MGRGDRFQEPRFTVPMPGGDYWPFEVNSRSRARRLEVQSFGACAACGYVGAVGKNLSHYDARDAGRPRRRVCFGRAT